MPTLAYFVSSHGYGHAARACAIIAKLAKKQPETRFIIVSQAPRWFFQESLPNIPFTYLEHFTDVGFVQKSPFEEDPLATLNRLQKKLPFTEPQVQRLVQVLNKEGCQGILCDISPLGILVARALGIPSVLVENFTWDWLYDQYAHVAPQFKNFARYFHDIYMQAHFRFQTKPFTNPVQNGIPVPPVSRDPQHTKAQMRSLLRIPTKVKVVLISTGGIRTHHAFVPCLQKRDDVFFIIPHDVPQAVQQGNVLVLPHHSRYFHPDLVRVSDAVICKSGYSTVAEAFHINRPLGLIIRPHFPESPFIEAFVKSNFNHLILEPDTFRSGTWIDALDSLLDKDTEQAPRFRLNGAQTIADFLSEKRWGTF